MRSVELFEATPRYVDIREAIVTQHRKSLRALAVMAICRTQLESCQTGKIDFTQYDTAKSGCTEAQEAFEESVYETNLLIDSLQSQLHRGALRHGPIGMHHRHELIEAQANVASSIANMERMMHSFDGACTSYYARFIELNGKLLKTITDELVRYELVN